MLSVRFVDTHLGWIGHYPIDIHVFLVQELAQISNQHVVADLRAADIRAGHWLADDPALDAILSWIRSRP
jgi:hypothetical protein